MPQPPMATEYEIKDAMEARGDWFVPVLISDLRQTADKGSEVTVQRSSTLLILSHCHLSQRVNPRQSSTPCSIRL